MIEPVTITTIRGATVTLTADKFVSATVNGKPMEGRVSVERDRQHGYTIKIGHVTAVIDGASYRVASAFERQVAESLRTDADRFSDQMHRRMYGRNSDH